MSLRARRPSARTRRAALRLLACVGLCACAPLRVATRPPPVVPPPHPALVAAAQAEADAGFSGAVLVLRAGRVLLDDAYGQVRGITMRRDQRFWIASAGKQFTAAAVLRCTEMGLLTLDAPLARALPDAPADKRAITLRQILSYTSGLPQSDAGEEAAGAAEAIAAVLALPMAAQPGERFIYSNANYVLAAAIVERVSGRPFSGFLRREVLARARLYDTGQAAMGDAHVAPIAGELPARLVRPRWSALGYYSTTADLARWATDLAERRALAPASVEAMLQAVIAIGEGHAALGWFIGRTEAGALRIFTRGNEDFGANSLIYFYPASRTIIVALSHGGDKTAELSWSRAMHAALEAALAL